MLFQKLHSQPLFDQPTRSVIQPHVISNSLHPTTVQGVSSLSFTTFWSLPKPLKVPAGSRHTALLFFVGFALFLIVGFVCFTAAHFPQTLLII